MEIEAIPINPSMLITTRREIFSCILTVGIMTDAEVKVHKQLSDSLVNEAEDLGSQSQLETVYGRNAEPVRIKLTFDFNMPLI